MFNKTTASIFAIVASLGMLTTSTAIAATMQPAHDLTRFFNCTTQVANKTHNLTIQEVNACYNKEFHSTGGPGTGGTTTTSGTPEGHKGSTHHIKTAAAETVPTSTRTTTTTT